MQLTKQIIKFNNWFVSIPKAMKGIWDNSENRWGTKKNDISLYRNYKR